MNWIETTLRKGAKTPRICRDMFIADSRGIFTLVQVKNGKQASREEIDYKKVIELKTRYMLRNRHSGVFNSCSTYRTDKSWAVVDHALSMAIF